ncbi:MAG: FAD:protein FMN transferase [Oscillospiraceae bacterium]|nr:FAD:protein FMN transferase [Oscillospiraceae bacterium]
MEGIAIRAVRIVLALLVAAGAAYLCWNMVQKKLEPEDPVSIPEPEILYTGEDFVMDTFVTQKVSADNGSEVILDVNELLHDLEAEWSAYRDGSVPAKINAAAGALPAEVTAEQYDIIRKVYDFSVMTGGRFDLTVSPLVKLWNITSGEAVVPSADRISTALSHVGYENIVLDDEAKTVFLPRPGIQLDFGGSLKGYAVEKALEYYQQSGVEGAMISIGGSVAVTGKKPAEDGGVTDFRVGLRDPLGSPSDYYGVLTLADQVICSSGGYERYFEQDGVVYHHILDPDTGYPAESDLLSVTVISGDGLLCDCMSTWLYMGGTELVKEHLDREDYSVIAVDEERKIWMSDDLAEHFVLRDGSGYEMAK